MDMGIQSYPDRHAQKGEGGHEYILGDLLAPGSAGRAPTAIAVKGASTPAKGQKRRRNWRNFIFSSRRRHTRCSRDWSSDVCSSDLSDGLVEAHNADREMFGFPRLKALVERHPGGAQLIDLLVAELARLPGPHWGEEDDVTFVTLQRATATAAPPAGGGPPGRGGGGAFAT